MEWTFSLFEVYAGHSLAGMKYYHLILTLTVVLALPTITLAKDYLGIGPDGVTQNKSELLADIKSGTLKLESSTMSDMKIQVAGPDMAVVVYRSTDKGTYKGKDVTGEYRWLDVFVKRDGKWQIAIDQGTQIKP